MRLPPQPLTISDPHGLIAELQRHDFMSFLIGCYPKLRGGADLKPNWHLDAIAYQLQRVERGQCRRLLTLMPPRHLKSITISVAWVAWRLGRNPRLNFVCVSYSQPLSLKLARDCRALMQTPWYRHLFPKTIIQRNRSAAHDFETTLGGGRLATSVGGTLTGRGGDIIIVDDPINPMEANSDTQRDAANDWFASTLSSRLNDKATGAIIVVMQRLHQYDPAGVLIQRGGWDQLMLPAIAIEDGDVPLTRGRVYHRKAGEVLHPDHESIEALEDVKRMQGSSYFSAQYQQDPVPASGNVIMADWLKKYERVDPQAAGHIVQSWDTASKDGALNDWSVGITARVDRGEVYILDVFRRKLNFPDLKREVIAQARKHQVSALLIEDQASGQQLIQTLHAERPQGIPFPIACKPTGDQLSRLLGVSGQVEGGQLVLPTNAPWLAEFKSELLSFPSGRNDDQVDALTQLMHWVLRTNRGSAYEDWIFKPECLDPNDGEPLSDDDDWLDEFFPE